MPLDPPGNYSRPHYQDKESKKLYLIHRNKYREAAQTRRQRIMAQMKKNRSKPQKKNVTKWRYAISQMQSSKHW